MAIKLHRCSGTWIKMQSHPCWRVQSALNGAGISYEVVKHPVFPRGRRNELERLSGQRLLPVIEFEDGSILREESADMAARIRAGRLRPEPASAPSGSEASAPSGSES